MRRLAIGPSAYLCTLAHILAAGEPFVNMDPFQGAEAMLVVGLPRLRTAARLRHRDLS
jgi:hypothetical protein